MGIEDRHPSASGVQIYEFALGDELRGERATKGKTLLDVQRDLRIQATYIAAIENGDIAAFPNPSFIPGYVRSYARYLDLDPAVIYRRFCAEHGFAYAAAGSRTAASREKATPSGARTTSKPPSFQPKFPLTEPKRRLFSGLQLSAVGSVAVLLLLIAGLGYGGWMVLKNIQRVQFAPVEDLPIAQAEMEPMPAPEADAAVDDAFADLASPVAAASLAELYRQQELEVPILEPRDGPIAAIDPDSLAPLHLQASAVADHAATAAEASVSGTPIVVAPLIEAVYAEEARVDAAAAMAVNPASDMALSIIAERAAWIRVYQENGTIIFERILERGESYTPPMGVEKPLIWAGNSGSVYIQLGDALHGPLGRGTRAVRDIPLDPVAVAKEFPVVSDIPEIISQRTGATVVPAGSTVAIQ